jgi:hypothetical protein
MQRRWYDSAPLLLPPPLAGQGWGGGPLTCNERHACGPRPLPRPPDLPPLAGEAVFRPHRCPSNGGGRRDTQSVAVS